MVFIFRPGTSRIRIFECPHRLSDKLLKSSATRLSLTVARWRILRFPLSESTLNFRIFLFNRPAVCVK
ncbi:hypothetical protein C4768_13420 [Salmonella enterica subsp. enterica serovar Havana]|nr:hypothetical protein C4768_13420 [Salmonella enterica subsp. enterica serovar Havana]